MANIPFKSITFPGLPNKYTVPEISSDLMTAGKAADAKATGDALALKADKSTTYTKTEVDALIDEVEIETDTTLSISGKPADSKTVGDELSDIKADLGAQNEITFTDTSGYITDSGAVSAAGDTTLEKYTSKIKVNPGDVLRFSITLSARNLIWVGLCTYTEAEGWISRESIANQNGTKFETDVSIANDVGYVRFTYRTYGSASVSIKSLVNLFTDVRNAETDIIGLHGDVNRVAGDVKAASLSVMDFDTILTETGYLFGNGNDGSSSNYKRSGFISVSEGDVFEYRLKNANNAPGISFYTSADKSTIQTAYSVLGDFTVKTGTWTAPANGYVRVVAHIDVIGNGGYFRYKKGLPTQIAGIKVNANMIGHALRNTLERFAPCCDHLFVGRTGENVTVPHESLYHVRLSRALGFNCIEANVQNTSDNVYFVNHLQGGKFDRYFYHIDGETDISDISASSVTWDWIAQNVRYYSQIPKYRTRPVLLTEFLAECRQQNILPFLGRASDANVIAIADAYMGAGNYIAYGATRATCPSGIIYHWVTKTTKAEILEYCESIGKPFIYGMSNVSSFTDLELKDIADTLHVNGYWIGTSYADNVWSKLSALGFDLNNTQTCVNRIKVGNLHDLNTIFGFDDFVFTNATETDGVLTYSADGTLSPDIESVTHQVSAVDIELWFNGSVTIPQFGEFAGATYTSDGSQAVFVAIPVFNSSAKCAISVSNGTVVYDVKYKVSVC